LKHRLPTISELPAFATDGGLASYGFDGRESLRLRAETVDQILRGAQASEVPIRQVGKGRPLEASLWVTRTPLTPVRPLPLGDDVRLDR
jgi:hypothetical protein